MLPQSLAINSSSLDVHDHEYFVAYEILSIAGCNTLSPKTRSYKPNCQNLSVVTELFVNFNMACIIRTS